jgi:hypothetical protein
MQDRMNRMNRLFREPYSPERPWALKPRRVNFKPVLHRPVELAPFFGNYDPNLGWSVGEIVSESETTRELSQVARIEIPLDSP